MFTDPNVLKQLESAKPKDNLKKTIEIIDIKEDRILKKIHFISNPISSIIKKSDYLKMFEEADRSAETGKIISLLDFLETFQAKIHFYKNYTVNSLFLSYTMNIRYYKLDLISFINIFIINLI